MASLEKKASVPDITPGSEWYDGSLWEDFSIRDFYLNNDGNFEEGAIDFYSYGRPVVEADIVITHDELGNKLAYIDDIARPEGYIHDAFTDPDTHLISTFRTIFTGLNLDQQIKKIDATPTDLYVIAAVLRAGVPAGWKRQMVDGSTGETTDNWKMAWDMMLRSKNMIISYERQPDLRGVDSGHLALSETTEITA
jgi:hypothetical protein